MKHSQTAGHLLALLTIGIWGTTFISTKLLLEALGPVEILFIRFLMGYIALLLVCPKKLPWGGWRRELTLIAAGLSGVTFYYLLSAGKHCAVLCDLGQCGAGAWAGKDQCIYLHGSGDYAALLPLGAGRTADGMGSAGCGADAGWVRAVPGGGGKAEKEERT